MAESALQYAARRGAGPRRRMAWLRAAAAMALAFCGAPIACAANLSVLSAAAVQVPATEVADRFERATGHRVVFEFATAGQVDERLATGVRPDVVITGSGRIAPWTGTGSSLVRNLGTVRIGVAVRKGAPRPDLSSVAQFRAALLRAQTVAYGDPARGATTGVHFSRVIDQLDLRSALAGKSMLAANGLDVMRMVSEGRAELGITQVSEILHVDPATYAGPLPDALQLATTYAAWVSDPDNAAARAFVEALIGAEGRARFRTAGFD